MEFKTIIIRRITLHDEKIWVETKSNKTGYDASFGLCEWANCFYISFLKDDFPKFIYPDNNNYINSDFSSIEFHWGITFYEEKIINDKTIITIGCDFMHLYDNETYGREDSGELILKNHAEKYIKSFFDVYKLRSS